MQPREIAHATRGTRLAMSARMRKDPLIDLLMEIHRNVERLCEELQNDRPDLARAIRVHSAWIPPPEQLERGKMPPTKIAVQRLGPLLYDALDEGLVDPQRFDALMIERSRAQRILETKEP